MIQKDIAAYFEKKFEKESFTQLSSNHQTGTNEKSLVYSDEKAWNFDKYVEEATGYSSSEEPGSADALFVKDNGDIVLIEFKSGFKQKIKRSNWDKRIGECPIKRKADPGGNAICTDYWDLFWKHQEVKLAQLRSSLRMKAAESYTILEKHVFPDCTKLPENKSIKLIFMVVIDEDAVSAQEDMMAELAKTTSSETNPFKRVRNSLKRFRIQKDKNNCSYYYDDILVISYQEFDGFLHAQMKTA